MKNVKNYFQLISFLLIALVACKRDTKSGDVGATRAIDKKSQTMRDSIDKILGSVDLLQSTYENGIRAEALKAEVRNTDKVAIMFAYARELLNNGDTEDAIVTIQDLISKVSQFQTINQQSKMFHEFLAVCYLRLGEQENCLHNHSDESCIVPIEGDGVHKATSGSEKAIIKYMEILKVFPDDWQSRWLLNIAHMTLDQYPAKVPNEFLIQIDNTGERTYENIATQMGVDWNGLSGGSIAEDFNNDGFLDIMSSSWGSEGEIKFYLNSGDGSFLDATEKAGLSIVKGGLNLKQTDYNNDGFMDFYITRSAWIPSMALGMLPNSLMKNNGDGTFSDVTIETGLYSVTPTQTVSFDDFNNDGWEDLFVANETTQSSDKQYPCEMFINEKGVFKEVGAKLGVDLIGQFKGTSSTDINNDGWQDIYLADLNGPNQLLQAQHSEGKLLGFKNITEQAGIEKPFASLPCWFFDFDNDGWEDIYVASFDKIAFQDHGGQFARDISNVQVTTEENCLYRNNKNGTFTNVTQTYFKARALPAMGCNFGDINNDGFPDFLLGTGAPDYRAVVPNRLFLNLEGNKFRDVTFIQGVGNIQKGHGTSFADYDNDGDQDIYITMGGAFKGDKFPNSFFENADAKNNWIKLKLIGETSNRNAVGARIEVHGKTQAGESKVIHKRVGSGSSFGANPMMAEIGLGDIADIEKVLINWPNGKNIKTEYVNFKVNTKYVIHEHNGKEEDVLKTFAFKKNKNRGGHHHHH